MKLPTDVTRLIDASNDVIAESARLHAEAEKQKKRIEVVTVQSEWVCLKAKELVNDENRPSTPHRDKS